MGARATGDEEHIEADELARIEAIRPDPYGRGAGNAAPVDREKADVISGFFSRIGRGTFISGLE
ncbi:hypothetical protein CS8_081940 [Cupriavidus sp. 8B]